MSSKKYQNVGCNDSGFDNYVIFISLPKSYTNVKITKKSRGLKTLIFRAGSFREDDRKKPKYVKIVCSICLISGSSKAIPKGNNIQPQILKGEIELEEITLSNYKNHENQWNPYLTDDVLELAYVVSKHGNSIKKKQMFHIKFRQQKLLWGGLVLA